MENKTPWRKHLDPRYLSGESLLMGMKGLKKEMIVTVCKFEDAPAFDQKLQTEVDKTALWLKEYPSGILVYKPCLLNVERGKFLSKEIGNNSLFMEDFDVTKPFVLYAKPDKRHGHVVAFRKYFPPPAITDVNGLSIINKSTTLAELQANWNLLTADEKNLPTVLAKKETLKTQLK